MIAMRAMSGLILLPLVLGILYLVAILVAALRLFGVLFFFETVSAWAFAPAISIIALVILANVEKRSVRYAGAVFCIALYVAGECFNQSSNVLVRLAKGGDPLIEAREALLVFVLACICMLPRGSRPPNSL